jgi:hypothetical protein
MLSTPGTPRPTTASGDPARIACTAVPLRAGRRLCADGPPTTVRVTVRRAP